LIDACMPHAIDGFRRAAGGNNPFKVEADL
jgi:hypothetical protein